jgi:aminopeptidase N
MFEWNFRKLVSVVFVLVSCVAAPLSVQTTQQANGTPAPQAAATLTRADILRGEYGPYRANNHVLFYHLDIRVDPDRKFISGKNTVRFKMLKDGTRIQLDLHPALRVDNILLGTAPLKYERELGAVFIDFPMTLRAGHVYTIDFLYSGNPVETARFGGLAFR